MELQIACFPDNEPYFERENVNTVLIGEGVNVEFIRSSDSSLFISLRERCEIEESGGSYWIENKIAATVGVTS